MGRISRDDCCTCRDFAYIKLRYEGCGFIIDYEVLSFEELEKILRQFGFRLEFVAR